MSFSQRSALQSAVYGRLVSQLAGAGTGQSDVPVFDHVPSNPSRLHIRVEGWFYIPSDRKGGTMGRHRFRVKVFDENTGANTSRGMDEVTRLQTIVVAALENWSPITGATAIELLGSEDAPDDETGLIASAVCQFSTTTI